MYLKCKKYRVGITFWNSEDPYYTVDALHYDCCQCGQELMEIFATEAQAKSYAKSLGFENARITKN